MPVIDVATNISLSQEVKIALAKELGELIGKATKSKSEHIHVLIQEGVFLSFGGDHETPAAYISVRSVTSQLSGDSRQSLAGALVGILAEKITGLNPARTYTVFLDVPVEHVAIGSTMMLFNAKTFRQDRSQSDEQE